MAMVPITPVQVAVRCDWFDGTPRIVRIADEEFRVVSVARVRREAAAYPRATGPRTLFEVDTPRSRLSLTFEHRARRWTVDALDSDPILPMPAA